MASLTAHAQPTGVQIGRVHISVPSVETTQDTKKLSNSLSELNRYQSRTFKSASHGLQKKSLVVRRSKSNTKKGAWIGLGVGAATGGLIGLITYTECESKEFLGCTMHPASPGDAFLTGAVLGGLAGLITGAIIGSTKKPDSRKKWPIKLSSEALPSTRALQNNRIRKPVLSVRIPIGNK
ncbi:MAG: hypothetical protein R3211_05700 [Balneolaceae bacterium]|nr:hypothetical protein [Balneolaceae bacterium]